MEMTIDRFYFRAGRRIDITENPHCSSQFARGSDDGILIEVLLKKGTPTIYLTYLDLISRLGRTGVTKDEVFTVDAPVSVKYTADTGWRVINQQSGVEFRLFDGSNSSVTELDAIYQSLATPKSRRIVLGAVRATVTDGILKVPGSLGVPSLLLDNSPDALQDAMAAADLSGNRSLAREIRVRLAKITQSGCRIGSVLRARSELD